MTDKNIIKQNILNILRRILILRIVFNYALKKKHLHVTNFKLKSSNIWNNMQIAKTLSQKYSSLKITINTIDQLSKNIDDLNSILELTEKHDHQLLNEIQTQLTKAEHTISQLEINNMFLGKYDNNNCYIDIQSGSGGIEAQDWSRILLRMYLRWIEKKGFDTEITNESIGEITGIKSATVRVSGAYAYGWLHVESGVHRLVRKSPFDSSKKRHTSFASIFVYPELDESVDINLRPEDIRYDVYRASGAGGQHVNRTESAVRVTHIPTNIVTQCQSHRSQHKNKRQAIKQLKSKLYELELQKKRHEKQIINKKKSDITWGNQIRSYILDNSRIKDLRTGFEKRNVKDVLDGDLDDFIKISIEKYSKEFNNND
ncbi:peptide chain release factor 2 [Candidatus Blochmannia ocreatus (nom. nud.)]|uniref:peptide chain release factor 2 n=1 Tax=Candidatus Blochmannia ocreatus (nom. nud.) TaxID=251538 RepID=UPI003C6C33C7